MGCGLDVLTGEVGVRRVVGGEEGGWRWGWGAAWTSSRPRLGVRRVVGGEEGGWR